MKDFKSMAVTSSSLPTSKEEILDALEDMWWQFGYGCGSKIEHKSNDGEILCTSYPYRHSGGLSALEEAESVLLKYGRIEKADKKKEWYKVKDKIRRER